MMKDVHYTADKPISLDYSTNVITHVYDKRCNRSFFNFGQNFVMKCARVLIQAGPLTQSSRGFADDRSNKRLVLVELLCCEIVSITNWKG